MKIIMYWLFLLLFISCKKEKPLPDYEIKLKTPLEGQIFKSGDSVFVSAQIIIRSGALHGYEIYAYDSSSLEVWLNKGVHIHDSIIGIDTFFVKNVQIETEGKFELRTYLSHSDTPLFISRNFKIIP